MSEDVDLRLKDIVEQVKQQHDDEFMFINQEKLTNNVIVIHLRGDSPLRGFFQSENTETITIQISPIGSNKYQTINKMYVTYVEYE